MDTKKLRQKILDLAIHGKLVPQDPNDEPTSVLLERIKAEKERLIKEGKIKRTKKSAKSSDTPHYGNVPFEVPDNWVWTDIEHICSKIGSGSTPRGSNYSSKGIPFFRSQNIYNGGLVYEDIKFISEEVHQTMIGTEVLPNDLLLNITGGSLGRCAIVPENFQRGNVSQHVCIMRPIFVVSEYFHAFVLSSIFSKSMKITGSGREGLPKYNLERMFFPLPPLSEQHRIVSEIENWFALIYQIEQGKLDLQKVIKKAKNKILDLAIHGKLVPQDPNDEPASKLLKRINPKAEITCDNGHYTQLPEGWAICKMKQITSITNGKSQKNVETLNGIYPIYGSGGVIGRANQYLCIAGSTIIGRKGTINNPIFVEEHFWNVDTAFGLKANDAILDKYLYYFCLSFDFSKLDKSTAMPSLTKTSIGNVLIPIPPYKEQERIVAKIDMVLDTMNEILRAV
ncbi:restriction endonuclease subunit S [Phocaeicola vulgatus]|nr:restriction endonuclease subunit S [Phocaeicola vulgatus]